MLAQVCQCGKQKICEHLVPMGITPKDYCDECVPRVQTFLDDRDLLHDEICALWHKKLTALYTKHGKDFELPDRPSY